MRLSDFDFPFDPSLIADRPTEPRDRAQLLILPRAGGACSHRRVSDLPTLLEPGDLLVVNDTKVLPARLTGRKKPGGGKVELVLVQELAGDQWEVLLKGKAAPGQVIELAQGASATVVRQGAAGTVVRVASARPIRDVMQDIGQVPLPPYIKRAPTEQDRIWYQTLFAKAEGAVAAPTAGLHFTESLLAALRQRGVRLATVTLHVGPATFRPVRTERIEEHVMLPEAFEVTKEAAQAIQQAKSEGRRVVAVGTTVVRTLEAAAGQNGLVEPTRGETGLFITPGYKFQVADAIMTNFHLPRTTLLMLVSAFAGTERLREAYQAAVKERYRFYSYGDVMLIV
jgi:S-adenosylmethionine:tRNA ribosyltransferase-isomerase